MFHLFGKARLIGLSIATLLILSLMFMAWGTSVRPISAQDNVLLQETFDDNTNNWQPMSTGATCKSTVGGGKLTLTNSKASTFCATTPDMTFPDDITMEVTITPPSGTRAWDYGIIIRADSRTTESAFYDFGVYTPGNWYLAIRTANGDSYKDRENGSLSSFDATAPITLKVVAQGTNFTYFVNDEQVGSWDDDTINNDPSTEKYIGLIVLNSDKVSKTVGQFTDLTVTGGQASEEPTATATPKKSTAKTPTPSKGKTPTPSKVKTKTPTPEPTEEQPTEQPAASACDDSNAILTDTFSDNANGWRTSSAVVIENDSLTINVSEENVLSWTGPKTKLPADIDACVTVTNPDPDSSGAWDAGIGVRGYKDADNKDAFYLFDVKGDGTATLTGQSGAKITANVIKSTTIDGYDPAASNTLRIKVKGSNFELYVNDQLVAKGKDTSLKKQTTYTLFLTAGTFKGVSSSSVVFTGLVVKKS